MNNQIISESFWIKIQIDFLKYREKVFPVENTYTVVHVDNFQLALKEVITVFLRYQLMSITDYINFRKLSGWREEAVHIQGCGMYLALRKGKKYDFSHIKKIPLQSIDPKLRKFWIQKVCTSMRGERTKHKELIGSSYWHSSARRILVPFIVKIKKIIPENRSQELIFY